MTALHLVSAVGTSSYTSTVYRLGDGRAASATPFLTEALAELLQPSRITLLLTAAAASHDNRRRVESRLRALGCGVAALDIPDGRNEAELWTIFDRIGALGSEPLALDITNAFRSLPLVALMAASFHQAAGALSLQHLFYGAFDRDRAEETPVFDLSPMLALPLWAQAARAWEARGDAAAFYPLIRAACAAGRAAGGRPRLNDLANELRLFTAQLGTADYRAAGAAPHLQERLNLARQDAAAFAPPLVPMLDRIAAPLSPLAQGGLAGQLALVRLQLRFHHLLAATLLAREWVVSWWRQEHALPSRQEAESALGALAHNRNGNPDPAVRAFDDLHQLRNALAHCGWEHDPITEERALDRLRRVLDVLAQLPTSLPTRPAAASSG